MVTNELKATKQLLLKSPTKMIRCLLLALGIGSALGGVSIQMPYLNPAGVTYTGLHAAVPAVPSHLQYSAATTSSVAYGNAAFLGRSLAPAVSYAAPVAAPVAHVAQYAAPVAHYAAPVIPTVHHVPAVAQVPVTKYEAQPAYIQNLVDVAKPKLASRKIEIRRPAIQKQFYDVEERVVIRPAGSAVVELDQPVSKSQKGPTVVQPAVHAISTPVVGFRSLHSHHHVVPAAYPGSFSVHPYPIQGPASIPISSTPSPHQEIEAQPEDIPQEPQHNTEQQETQQIPEQEYQQFPQQEQQQFQQQEQQQFQQQEQQQIPQQEPQQFDDSDSVSIDNPDIARARSQQPLPEQPQGQQQSPQGIPQPQDLLRSLLPQTRSQLFAPQQQLLERFQAMNVERQQAIARSQVQAQEQVVAQLQAQTQAQQAQLQRSEELLQLQQQQLVRSRQAVESVARSQLNQQQQAQAAQPQAPLSRSQGEQSEGLPSVGPEPQRGSVRILEAADLRSALFNNLARSTSSPSEIPSIRISPEQSISNQERLISLLTARGGILETRGQGESSNSHQVRARVLSVTPAPEGASPQEEKVNTRRIVVNRPIQTVEEVDVVEPFTKIERVAVHSPAVIKTARLGVAHVPTSVPVHGYAHALHAAIPAY